MSKQSLKLVPLTREGAAIVWASGGRPVYAMVNGLCQQIRPINGEPCPYASPQWNCRVLEDDGARFYLSAEVPNE